MYINNKGTLPTVKMVLGWFPSAVKWSKAGDTPTVKMVNADTPTVKMALGWYSYSKNGFRLILLEWKLL